MNLILRPVKLSDLPACMDARRDVFLFSDAERPLLLEMWRDLLRSGIATAMVCEDLDRTFGMSVVGFAGGIAITDAFAAEVKSGWRPYYPRHVLSLWQRGELSALVVSALRDVNVGEGFTMLNLHSGIPQALLFSEEGRPIRDLNPAALTFSLAGFRIKEFLNESYGDFQVQWAANLGLHVRTDNSPYFDRHPEERPAAEFHPFVVGTTPEEARAEEGCAMGQALLAAQTPHLSLKPGEQEMLLFALSGMTDEELAASLNLAIVTIRKRWDSVYERVAEVSPALRPANRELRPGTRGAEKKRRLLNYLRHHMEELRPISSQN